MSNYIMKQSRISPTRTFTLRVTHEVYDMLVSIAGDMPLGPFIVSRALNSEMPPPRVKRRRPIRDHQAYALLLAKFGDTRLASNMNQLAKQANIGTLAVTPETEKLLVWAVHEISDMRRLLIQALGLEDEQ